MKLILLHLFLFSSLFTFSQNKKSEQILEEGKLLFRLEKGSWYGTDDLVANFQSKMDSLGGYLSYETEEKKINTIFFSRFDPDEILVRYVFDSLPLPKPLKIDTLNRDATEVEKSLITIRKDASKKVLDNEDDFFKHYKNASLNYIPVINEKSRIVYIITGPQVAGNVLLGNDYRLKYNKKNEFVSKEKIHNSLLQFPYQSENKETPTVSTIHSHILSSYISSTDICTLLLYKDYVEWSQHIVVGEKEVSIFDLKKENLFVIKRKTWDKINQQ